MKKLLKLGLFFAATSLLLVIIGSLAVYHLLRVGEFRRFVITQLQQQTQLEVQLGQGEFHLGWIAGVGFQDLKLSEPAAAQPLLTAERITARIALLPLFQRKLIFMTFVCLSRRRNWCAKTTGALRYSINFWLFLFCSTKASSMGLICAPSNPHLSPATKSKLAER